MEHNQQPKWEADQYKELTKVCGKLTYISEPKKFILVFLLFQAGMLDYFLVTMESANPVLKVITIATYIAITLILFIFPFVDPGIIPKITGKDEHQTIPINMILVQEGREGYYYKEYCYVGKTHSFWAKYCGNCAIYRPPRTLHCYTCQVCIQKLDHHCPWLGACIGKRNYRFYLLYIFFMAVCLCLIIYQTVHFIVVRSFSDGQAQYIFNILLLALSVPSGLFVLILIGVHIKLSKENMTTNELWHSKWDLYSGNPFQKAFFLKNYMKIFGNIYTSKLDYQRNHAVQDIAIKQQTQSQQNIKKDEHSIAPTTHASEPVPQIRGLQIILKLNEPTQ